MWATIWSCSSGESVVTVEPSARQNWTTVSMAGEAALARGVTKQVRLEKRGRTVFPARFLTAAMGCEPINVAWAGMASLQRRQSSV